MVLSTKALPVHKDRPLKPKRLRKSVEKSLKRLRTDHVDLFFVHGMQVRDLHHTREVLVPELRALQQAGKIRFLAASEAFASDHGHDALGQSLDADDDWYDVLMVGHNPFNPSARDRVFAATEDRDIGVLVMFVVRKALASPAGVRRVVDGLVERGELDPAVVDADDPLGFLLGEGGAASLTEAAYRFARHEPGCHVVLTGTGSVDHLAENVASINGPRSPPTTSQRLDKTLRPRRLGDRRLRPTPRRRQDYSPNLAAVAAVFGRCSCRRPRDGSRPAGATAPERAGSGRHRRTRVRRGASPEGSEVAQDRGRAARAASTSASVVFQPTERRRLWWASTPIASSTGDGSSASDEHAEPEWAATPARSRPSSTAWGSTPSTPRHTRWGSRSTGSP